MRLSQSQADLLGTFIGLCVIAAILIWSCGCSVPRQPAGYVPDDVRHSVIVTAGQGISVSRDGDWITIASTEPDTICDHDFNCDQPFCLVIHYCEKCGAPYYGSGIGSGIELFYTPMPAIVPPPCDHFYVKQAIPIDSPLAGFDLDMLPCICIYCKDLTVCKGDFTGWSIEPHQIISTTESGCSHEIISKTLMGCGGSPCNTCTCNNCGKQWKCY